jgi:uncharacterized phosphosugar-binding protein
LDLEGTSRKGDMTMGAIEDYHQSVSQLFKKILDSEQERILKGASLLADAMTKDRLIYILGTGGHSMMGAEEMFWRAGGLVPIYPILDAGLSVINGALRSNIVERMPGYIGPILKYHGLSQGDLLIICNAYGINSATIDAVLECRKLGVTSLAITSTDFCKGIPAGHPSRHPSRQNLFEVADHYINCWMPYGDAVVSISPLEQKVCPTSSMVNLFTLNCLVGATVEELIRRGVEPPVWTSANLPGGDEANRKHFEKYGKRVRFL